MEVSRVVGRAVLEEFVAKEWTRNWRKNTLDLGLRIRDPGTRDYHEEYERRKEKARAYQREYARARRAETKRKSRAEGKTRCGNCGEKGHNRRTCPTNDETPAGRVAQRGGSENGS